MTEEIHYCKECKYAKVTFFEKMIMGYEFAKCLAFLNTEESDTETLVQGNSIRKPEFCSIVRRHTLECSKTCPRYQEK